MGILGKLFGSEKVIDAGIAGIDKAFYTKEEKAQDHLKQTGYKLEFLKQYEAFKVAQRFVAIILAAPFVVLHSLIIVLWLLVLIMSMRFGGEYYDFASQQLHLIADMNNKTLGEPIAWVVIFYFAGGAGEGIVKKFMTGRSNGKQ